MQSLMLVAAMLKEASGLVSAPQYTVYLEPHASLNSPTRPAFVPLHDKVARLAGFGVSVHVEVGSGCPAVGVKLVDTLVEELEDELEVVA